MKLEIGMMVKLTENAKETYEDMNWKNKPLKIIHIARNEKEHRGYDETMEGMALCDFETLDGQKVCCSLYEYEFELCEQGSFYKTMTIEIIERCFFETEEGKEDCGLRKIIYEVEAETLQEAYNLYEDNFDSDNVLSSEDNFEEECLYSETVSVSLYE